MTFEVRNYVRQGYRQSSNAAVVTKGNVSSLETHTIKLFKIFNIGAPVYFKSVKISKMSQKNSILFNKVLLGYEKMFLLTRNLVVTAQPRQHRTVLA